MVDYQSPKNDMNGNKTRSAIPSSKTILIIEDEADIKILLDYNLQAAGFGVIQASNGEEGLLLAI
ncbi:MAG TPA: hypothetical protein DCF85_05280, partial [Alphaproteobacteria bacterium]|nr:hypothetical protein [Alphaproteobacteria bacterium]